MHITTRIYTRGPLLDFYVTGYIHQSKMRHLNDIIFLLRATRLYKYTRRCTMRRCFVVLMIVACVCIIHHICFANQEDLEVLPKVSTMIVFEISEEHTTTDIAAWADRIALAPLSSRWTILCIRPSMCTSISAYKVIHIDGPCVACAKYRYLESLLRRGTRVFVCPVTTSVIHDPFPLLHTNRGVVALIAKSEGASIGRDFVHDDPGMGWSRYMHGFEISHVPTDILALHADNNTVQIVSRLPSCLLVEGESESSCLTRELFRPSTIARDAHFESVRGVLLLLHRSDTMAMLKRGHDSGLPCTPPLYKYHVLLHAMSGTFQKWQTLLAWESLLKISRRPCSPIGNMTRILSGESDDLMHHIPTFQIEALLPSTTNGYAVINRPWALSEWLRSEATSSVLEYVLILEPDHIMQHAVPCKATPDVALVSWFHYMRLDYPLDVATGFKTVCDMLKAKNLSSTCNFDVGAPSPLLIHKNLLSKYVDQWYRLCIKMMQDAQVKSALGWVLEMWAFGIAYRNHVVVKTLHQEPIKNGNVPHNDKIHITHYPYIFGTPRWTFDKYNFKNTFPSILFPPYEMRYLDPCGYELVRKINHAIQSPWVAKLWTSVNPPKVPVHIAWSEVLLVLCNINLIEMLHIWATQVSRIGITNWVVVCIDQATADAVLEKYGQKHVHARVDLNQAGHVSHSVSALKYDVAMEYLNRNCAVLISDLDVVILQNPFQSNMLVRDSDVEGMSDGFDACSTYGCTAAEISTWKQANGHSHIFRIADVNVGWIYLRPTSSTIRLMERVALRLKQFNVWDQVEFNDELWKPSAPVEPYSVEYMLGMAARRSTTCSIRIIPRETAVNSKVWFLLSNSTENLYRSAVVVHMNYHPDKLDRMKIVIQEIKARY